MAGATRVLIDRNKRHDANHAGQRTTQTATAELESLRKLNGMKKRHVHATHVSKAILVIPNAPALDAGLNMEFNWRQK